MINSIKRSCLLAKLIILGYTCQALIDSGSAVSILSTEFVRKCDIDLNSLKKNSQTLSAANGSTIVVHGEITISFELDNETITYDFIVADIDEVTAILGNDFLEEFDVQLKFGKALMKIGKHKIKLIRHESSKIARIRLVNTCSIPADSEMTINANIDGLFLEQQGIVEPYKLVQKRG